MPNFLTFKKLLSFKFKRGVICERWRKFVNCLLLLNDLFYDDAICSLIYHFVSCLFMFAHWKKNKKKNFQKAIIFHEEFTNVHKMLANVLFSREQMTSIKNHEGSNKQTKKHWCTWTVDEQTHKQLALVLPDFYRDVRWRFRSPLICQPALQGPFLGP